MDVRELRLAADTDIRAPRGNGHARGPVGIPRRDVRPCKDRLEGHLDIVEGRGNRDNQGMRGSRATIGKDTRGGLERRSNVAPVDVRRCDVAVSDGRARRTRSGIRKDSVNRDEWGGRGLSLAAGKDIRERLGDGVARHC
jgi:hypothetical protein